MSAYFSSMTLSSSDARSRGSMGGRVMRAATRAIGTGVTQDVLMAQADIGTGSNNSVGVKRQSADEEVLTLLMTGEERIVTSSSRPAVSKMVKYMDESMSNDMRKAGAQRKEMMRVVKEDEDQCKTCMGLPLTIFFATLFITFFQLYFDSSLTLLSELSLRTSFGDAASNVNTASDIYAWMDQTFFPFLWSCPNVDGSAASQTIVPAAHELAAGVRLRTAVGPVQPCDGASQGDGDCFPESSRVWDEQQALLSRWDREPDRRLSKAIEEDAAVEARRAAKRRRAGLPKPRRRVEGLSRPAGARAGAAQRRPDHQRRLDEIHSTVMDQFTDYTAMDHTYTTVIPMSMPLSEVRQLVQQWQYGNNGTDPLITKQMLFLAIDVMLRNKEMGEGRMTYTQITFILSRGGVIFVETKYASVVLRVSPMPLSIIVLWLLILAGYTVVIPSYTIIAIRSGAFWSHVVKASAFFEYIFLAGGWANGLLLLLEVLGVKKNNEQWAEYNALRPSIRSSELRDFDKHWYLILQDSLAPTCEMDGYLQILVAVYTNILLFRFMMASQGHRRLALTINTLREGTVDLAHLLVVFGVVMAGYIMSGHLLFGRRIEEFSTVKGALGYTLQIVLQRQYIWEELTAQDLWTVTVWVWSLMLLVVMVVVNIVLAMIFDRYGEVRGGVTADDTVFRTTSRILTQLRFMSTWASNTDLLVAFSKLGRDELVSAKNIKDMLPHMCPAQVDYLFSTAKTRLQTRLVRENRNVLSESFASILLGIEELKENVVALKTGQQRRPDKLYTTALTGSMLWRNSQVEADDLPTKTDIPSEVINEGTVDVTKKPKEVEAYDLPTKSTMPCEVINEGTLDVTKKPKEVEADALRKAMSPRSLQSSPRSLVNEGTVDVTKTPKEAKPDNVTMRMLVSPREVTKEDTVDATKNPKGKANDVTKKVTPREGTHELTVDATKPTQAAINQAFGQNPLMQRISVVNDGTIDVSKPVQVREGTVEYTIDCSKKPGKGFSEMTELDEDVGNEGDMVISARRKLKVVAPEVPPGWVTQGLVPHLQRQREITMAIHARMVRLQERMQQKGMVTSEGFPLPKPKTPESLFGDNRDGSVFMVKVPRPTPGHGCADNLATRLGRL